MRSILIIPIAALTACGADAAPGERGADTAPSHGGATARSYDVGAFDSVSLAGRHDVVVQVGAAPSVRAEGDAQALDRLKIGVDGHRLEIGEIRNTSWSPGSSRGRATIYVTMPAIKAADLGGSGNIRIDRVAGDKFSASLGGSGNIDVGAMQVANADLSLAGSGNIKASGKAGSANISIAGSGNVEAGAVETRTASISIMGSGNANVRALDKANVVLMGSGDARIGGSAKCSLTKMGSGSLHCGS